MKSSHALSSALCAILVAQAFAQTPPPALAASVGLMAFPSKGQDAKTQNIDEGECYGWAKQQSGFDPGAPPPAATAAKVEPPPAQPTGARARGAVRGAAAGAVVGE